MRYLHESVEQKEKKLDTLSFNLKFYFKLYNVTTA